MSVLVPTSIVPWPLIRPVLVKPDERLNVALGPTASTPAWLSELEVTSSVPAWTLTVPALLKVVSVSAWLALWLRRVPLLEKTDVPV